MAKYLNTERSINFKTDAKTHMFTTMYWICDPILV